MRYTHSPIARLISILHRRTHVYFERRLKPHDLSFSQFRMLAFAAHHDGVKQEDLRRFIDADKGATAHAVRGLVERGLLTRDRDSVDRRAYAIRATPEGQALLAEFAQVAEGWTDRMTEGFSADETRLAEDLLQRMLENTNGLIDDEFRDLTPCRPDHT